MLTHLDDLVVIIRAFAQHLHGAIGGLLPHAGDKALLLRRKVIEPQKAEKAQVKHQQPAHQQCGQDLRREALVIRQRVLGIELPQWAVAEGFHHPHHFACQHQPLPLPQDLRRVAQRFQRRAVHNRQQGEMLPCPVPSVDAAGAAAGPARAHRPW